MASAQKKTFHSVKEVYNQPEVISYFKDFSQEETIEEERLLAEKYFHAHPSILLIGGGGKKDVLFWGNLAGSLTVADLSEEMLRVSVASLAKKTFCVAANLTHLPFNQSKFDGIVVCDSVYGHIAGKKNRQKILKELVALLTEKGVLFLHAGGWLSTKLLPWWRRRLGKWRVLKQWFCGNFSAREPGDAACRTMLSGFPPGKPIFYHFFQTPDEIDQELRETGLNMVDHSGSIWVLQA